MSDPLQQKKSKSAIILKNSSLHKQKIITKKEVSRPSFLDKRRLSFFPKFSHHVGSSVWSHMLTLRILTKYYRSLRETAWISYAVHPIGVLINFGFCSALVLFEIFITDLFSSCKRCKVIIRIMKDDRRGRCRTLREWHGASCYDTNTMDIACSRTSEHASKPPTQWVSYHIHFTRINTIVLRDFIQNSIKKLIISQISYFISRISSIPLRTFLWQSCRINGNQIPIASFLNSIIPQSIIRAGASMKGKH